MKYFQIIDLDRRSANYIVTFLRTSLALLGVGHKNVGSIANVPALGLTPNYQFS
jgi:hypothetical protein